MIPTISQCPVVVSLPGLLSAQRPKFPIGESTPANPAIGLILPSPSRLKFGNDKGLCRAIFPRVSLPSGSPYDAQSGIAPIPTLSSTIHTTRLNDIELLPRLFKHGLHTRRPIPGHV